MCNHENAVLIGTANGIQCRRCGRVFKTFEEYRAETEKPAESPETAQAAEEKPKRGRKKKINPND